MKKELDSNLKQQIKEHNDKIRNDNIVSVSSILNSFVIPFDYDKVIKIVANKRGVSIKEIAKEWDLKRDTSCLLGENIHKFAYKYTTDRTIIPYDKYTRAIVKFWDTLPSYYKPILLETTICHKKYLYKGVIDLLVYNEKDNFYTLYDYKTSEKLKSDKGYNRMYPPFSELLDSTYNKYQLQLGLYKLLLQNIGVEVKETKIIWLRKDGTYGVYRTKNHDKELTSYLDENR